MMSLDFRITSLNNDQVEDWKLIVALTCRAMLYLGSSINPVIYAFVGQHFREKLTDTFLCMFQRKRRISKATQFMNNGRIPIAPVVVPKGFGFKHQTAECRL